MLFCIHVHAADFILVSIFTYFLLIFAFSLPCLHRTCSNFSVGSNSDSIWASFYGRTFAHFRILSDFGFQPLTLVFLRFYLAKEINKPSQTSLVYLTTWLMFKAYLFALEFPLSKVQQIISLIIKITLYFL